MHVTSVGFAALQTEVSQATLTTDILVVLGVVVLALALFLTERLPIDVTAIALMVILIVLEPWTQISPRDGISGFANEATITVLAMLILSSGIARTGLVQRLGKRMAAFAGESVQKQVLATVGVTSPVSGFLNNTPVVALLVPVVTDVANRGNTSPSKLLIPLSYASQIGGMLTLIGTSTNLLASDVSRRLGEEGYDELHAFSMFEFTQLGLVVVLVGGLYLVFVGHRLLPERVPPRADYVEEYDVGEYLADLAIVPGSPLVGESVADATATLGPEIDVVQVVRDETRTIAPRQAHALREGDILVVRTDREAVAQVADVEGLEPVGWPETSAELTDAESTITEVVVAFDSPLVGRRLDPERIREELDAAVLGLRSRGELVAGRIVDRRLQVGDTLLVETSVDALERLSRSPDVIVAREPASPSYRTEKAPYAAAIMIGVVGVATLEFYPILVTALAGVVAMVLTGVLRPNELYEAVEWDVIFLLAGVIPLGMALERTGAAAFLAFGVVSLAGVLPTLVVLWLFYVATGLMTEVISNNASVVLLIPVAAASAVQIGANPFAFVLAVTFAASTSFLGPIGYQTNLFVYGPGGYRFGDYFRIGAPLQLLLSVVTVLGIAFFWGV